MGSEIYLSLSVDNGTARASKSVRQRKRVRGARGGDVDSTHEEDYRSINLNAVNKHS